MKCIALLAALAFATPAMAQYNPYSAMIQPVPNGTTQGYPGSYSSNGGMFLVSPVPMAPAPQVSNPYAPNPIGQGWQQFQPGWHR